MLTATFLAYSLLWSSVSAEELPLTYDIADHSEFTVEQRARAQAIYDATRLAVAREVNPSRPKDIKPRIILSIGRFSRVDKKIDYMESSHDVARVYLSRWNQGFFAEAVVLATTQQFFSGEEVVRLARDVIRRINLTVGIKEIK